MSTPDPEDEAFVEAFIDASTRELMGKSDADLAVWQADWKPGTEKHILAEKEWARRLGARQLREQFKLEERLAQRNRWWGLGASALGVVGTVVGTFLGAYLTKSSAPESTSAPAGHLSSSHATTGTQAARAPQGAASALAATPASR